MHDSTENTNIVKRYTLELYNDYSDLALYKFTIQLKIQISLRTTE